MSCERLRGDRLAGFDDGADPDEHERSCPDCIEARRSDRRVGDLIAGAHADRELPAAWFDATLAKIQAGPPRRARRGVVVGIAGVAAALAAIWLLWSRQDARDSAPQLIARLDRGGESLRGNAPRPGDRLVVHARGARRRYLELRVYRADRELVLRCAADVACRPSGDVVDATVTLHEAGRYRAVLLCSDQALPPADATLDQAAAEVSKQGGVAVLSEPFDLL